MRRAHKLPLVLSPQEVSRLFESVPSLKYRAAPMTCYGAGLRISKGVSLKVSDIDSKRMLMVPVYGLEFASQTLESKKEKAAKTATQCCLRECSAYCVVTGGLSFAPSNRQTT